MSDNTKLTEDAIKHKSKEMLKRISKCYNKCNVMSIDGNLKEIIAFINVLKVLKEQYLRMLEAVMEKGEYEKYEKIEELFNKKLSEIELKMINKTIRRYDEILIGNIENIRKTEEFQNFNNMDKALEKIQMLKELLHSYSLNINEDEKENFQFEISKLKFDALFRKQIEQLVFENGGEISTLTQYDSDEERDTFIKLLEEKIKSLAIKGEKQEEKDELLEMNPEEILENSQLLERLIIIDIKENPYNYMNLLKAKIFNAHLCNIANNPFKEEVYLTQKDIQALGFGRIQMELYNPTTLYPGMEKNEISHRENFCRKKFEDMKLNKVNFTLLRTLLSSIITMDNISIVECNNLFKRFGFECRPLVVNIGQECVKMLYEEVKESEEYQQLSEETKKKNITRNGDYCKLELKGVTYEFTEKEDKKQDTLEQIFSQRKIPSLRKGEDEESLKEEKERIKGNGIITYNIDILILLINDAINKSKQDIEKLKKEKSFYWPKEIDLNELENEKRRLEELKNKKLTLKEEKELLSIIKHIYTILNINSNNWELIPLEDMPIDNGTGSFVGIKPDIVEAEVLTELRGYHVEFRERKNPSMNDTRDKIKTYMSDTRNNVKAYEYRDSRPIYNQYEQDCKGLGIEIKSVNKNWKKPNFDIYVRLDDISDCPIDYNRVQTVPKEKVEEAETSIR